MTPKFIEHIHLDILKDFLPLADEMGNMSVSAVRQIVVKQVENIDNAICKEIRDMAVANGIDDVYVLDKKNILAALQKQIPKKPYSIFGKQTDFGCDCDHYVEKGDRYCWFCGQALDWGNTE